MTPLSFYEAFHHPIYTMSRCIPGFRSQVLTCSAGGMKPDRYSCCTFRGARQSPSEYRKECNAVFAMIEWNVLLSENTYSGCFLCRLFEPHSPVRGLSLLSFVMRRFHSFLTLHSIAPLISSAASQRESCIDNWRYF
jgi:hypothetical protein